MTNSCEHSTHGIADVDSGNSSSHSPSPDDTYESINTPNQQNRLTTSSHVNGQFNVRRGSTSNIQSTSSSNIEGMSFHIRLLIIFLFA